MPCRSFDRVRICTIILDWLANQPAVFFLTSYQHHPSVSQQQFSLITITSGTSHNQPKSRANSAILRPLKLHVFFIKINSKPVLKYLVDYAPGRVLGDRQGSNIGSRIIIFRWYKINQLSNLYIVIKYLKIYIKEKSQDS